jgi:hypothetical protein
VVAAVAVAAMEAARWVIFFTSDPSEHNDLASLLTLGAGLVVITAAPLLARQRPSFVVGCYAIAVLLVAVSLYGALASGLVPLAVAGLLALAPLADPARTGRLGSVSLVVAGGLFVLVAGMYLVGAVR